MKWSRYMLFSTVCGGLLWLSGCALPIPVLSRVPATAIPTPTAYPLPTRAIEPGLVRQVEVGTPSPSPERQNHRFARIEGELVAETAHLRIYTENGFLPVDLQEFQEEAEAVYAYVSERLDTSSDQKFAIAFRPPDPNPCPVRGLAISHPDPQTIIFADEETSRAQILGVLAHELGHLLHAHGLQVGGDTYLSEGLATWAAGTYWEAWQRETPAERVQTYLEEGRYVSLHEYYRQEGGSQLVETEDCLAERDRRYISWAAFLDFLIERYGMEKLIQLLDSTRQLEETPTPEPTPAVPPLPGTPTVVEERIISERAIQPPDFQGVYGLALNQLEDAWLRQLTSGE